ncbi:small integral membrane protein DUF2273 [Microbacterium sp. SLBN-146]|nr:small integral membrane protein DUF2273 [Microbacterium sp. SLBN-146]
MNAMIFGAAAGIALAFAALAFGFWGFLLVAVLATAGAGIGAIASGRIDVRAAVDAARGRRAA